MANSRLFRFRDRSSYKPSEVVGLFVISLIGGALICLTCVALDSLINRWLGR
jgi:hypothetical protein